MKIRWKSNIWHKFLPLLCFLILACGNDKPIQGFDPDLGFEDDDLGSIKKTIINSVDLQVTFEDTVTATGISPLLSIGKFANIDTKILLKFQALLPDTVSILDAALVLNASSITGEATGQTFQATVHRVTEDWSENRVKAENFGDAFDPNPLASTTILSVYRVDSLDIEVVRFDLNDEGVELVRQWADSASGVDNFGFLINSNNANFIKQFFAKEILSSSRAPQLEMSVMIEGADSDTTLLASAVADAYLAERIDPNLKLPTGPLYVDHLFSRQSVIRFGLSEIPKESTINRADLILDVQQGNSVLSPEGLSLEAVVLQNEVTTPDSLRLGSSPSKLSATPLIRESTTSIRLPIRSLLQAWVNETAENHGLLLRTTTPGLDISHVALHSCEDDSAFCPRLEVDYTVPPTIE